MKPSMPLDDRPVAVILISGVQGTGKTTFAQALAVSTGATQSMLLDRAVSGAGTVIVESAMAPSFREAYKDEARSSGVRVLVIECVCSDAVVHRERVERRLAMGINPISWSRASSTALTYVPDPRPDYVADAVLPVEHHVDEIKRILATG